ncbi:MAG: FkbM family methyltransferase [Gammaproteobacteria bacterium]|nr:FkbM family methyltransferase [Gammaproteobacteria bacterium]
MKLECTTPSCGGGGVNYFALEPMDKEALCCRLNNPGKTVLQQALWKENGRVQFYESTANDDSSIIEPPHHERVVNISAITLEKFAADHGIGKIKILKVETEGAEPEVLMGAEKILHRIEYIAADLGPERGLGQKTTLPMAIDFLYPRGFKLVGGYGLDRRNFLFRNVNFGDGKPM